MAVSQIDFRAGAFMLLTVRQVASRLNASVSTVYELIEDGALAYYRIGRNGGAIRIDEEDLAAYLVSARSGGGEHAPQATRLPAVKLRHLRV